jgi:hypothetical protein
MTHTESLVPEGKRLTNLTVAELDYASKRLGVNALTALTPDATTGEPHPRREMALAVVALVWARRQDPAAKLETFTGMELPELMRKLGMGRTAKEEEPVNVDINDPSPSPSG